MLFDANGPAENITSPDPICGSQNGVGYGAGGGAGCWYGPKFSGGSGSPGFVYIEWD